MRKIYLVRHGSTALNSKDSSDRIRGWANPLLSAEGHKEVEATAKKLKNSGITAIICSDLGRAVQTAEAIRETTGASLEANNKLRPWNVGAFTGQESKDVHPKLREYAKTPDKKIPEGESFNDFKNRFFEGLSEILEEYPEDKIAIVTHHRGERLIKSWMAEGQPKDKKIDMEIFFEHGEPPANAEQISLNEESLKKNSKSKALGKLKK